MLAYNETNGEWVTKTIEIAAYPLKVTYYGIVLTLFIPFSVYNSKEALFFI